MTAEPVLRQPLVSVVVLNYNGRRYIERCVQSLLRLKYPSDRLELIVVDNASPDGSADLVAERFPGVRLIRNPANWGFARGNNVGVRASRGEYVALLNNDTEVEAGWLAELVRVAESDPRIGLCTSKIRLFERRLELLLTVTPEGAVQGGDPPGAVLEEVAVERPPDRAVQYLEGAWAVATADRRVIYQTGTQTRLGIPVEEDDDGAVLTVELSVPPPPAPPRAVVDLRIVGAEQPLLRETLGAGEGRRWRIPLGAEALARALPVIQNAGSLIFPDGSGRDRGTVVRGTRAYYAADCGQYDVPEEVFAACGASMLMRRAMLQSVGLLDESLFLYYEDTDLSWRARLQGWKVVYVPGSIVRHVHCGSSVEWSELFLYQTERNRLAVLTKNAAPEQIARAWWRFVLGSAGTAVEAARALVRGHRTPKGTVTPGRRFWIRLRVLASLVRAIPALLRQRQEIQSRRRVGIEEIARWTQPPA